jgi:hypothetical protein
VLASSSVIRALLAAGSGADRHGDRRAVPVLRPGTRLTAGHCGGSAPDCSLAM